VRAEIAAAIKRRIRVIPVLVQGATMPSADQLPDTLRRFSRFQALELTDARWPFDVKRLVAALRDLEAERAVESAGAEVADMAPEASKQPTPITVGARETAAILSSDVVASTRLAEQLSPQEFNRILGRFVDEMAGAVERHKGEIAASIGDSIVAVFRAPDLPPEKRPARAVRRAVESALRIRLAQKTLNVELSATGIDVAVRTAVHAGELDVKTEGSGLWLMGDAANVAARLASRCAPGEILLSDAAYRLVADGLTVERTDDVVVRGITEPVTTWRLTTADRSAASGGR
jgi:class 3 adenylate cyclase